MKRGITAVIIGGAVFTGATAFAASLGGVTPQNLGASDSLVASCDTDGVAVAWDTSYAADNGKYQVDDIDVSLINEDCVGETISVTLVSVDGTTNTVLSESSATVVTGGTTNVDFTVDDVDAELVDHINILITQDESESAPL